MEQELTLIGHLNELRKRIIIVLVAFILSITAGFLGSPLILEFIKNQPSAQMINWNVFGFTDGFLIYFKCAVLIAILFTLPVLLYQLWAFVKPGLTAKEAKGSIIYVPISFLLFIVGVSFSYFVVFPMVIHFMSSINQSIGAIETYGISQYFTFMFNIILPISIIFEMPVVIVFLTKIGILNPFALKKMRKISYFVLVIVGVSITPPDFISDVLIIIPLLLLFELSIVCSHWTYKKRMRDSKDLN